MTTEKTETEIENTRMLPETEAAAFDALSMCVNDILGAKEGCQRSYLTICIEETEEAIQVVGFIVDPAMPQISSRFDRLVNMSPRQSILVMNKNDACKALAEGLGEAMTIYGMIQKAKEMGAGSGLEASIKEMLNMTREEAEKEKDRLLEQMSQLK